MRSVILFEGQDRAGFRVDLVLIFPAAFVKLDVVLGHTVVDLIFGAQKLYLIVGEAGVLQGDGQGFLGCQPACGFCGGRFCRDGGDRGRALITCLSGSDQ